MSSRIDKHAEYKIWLCSPLLFLENNLIYIYYIIYILFIYLYIIVLIFKKRTRREKPLCVKEKLKKLKLRRFDFAKKNQYFIHGHWSVTEYTLRRSILIAKIKNLKKLPCKVAELFEKINFFYCVYHNSPKDKICRVHWPCP